MVRLAPCTAWTRTKCCQSWKSTYSDSIIAAAPVGAKVIRPYIIMIMKQIIKLPERLRAIAGLIDDGAAVADIGTDHGYLPVYLAQAGCSRRIIGIDSSPGSLEHARRSAEKYGVEDKIELICVSGLKCIEPGDADTIVIAGVGGETIMGILDDAPWTAAACASGALKLILQPQTKLDVLKKFLHDKGYNVNSETTVADRGREYIILVC